MNESATVSYGAWERDPDVLPVLRVSRLDPSVTLLSYAYRRKVYEIWREGDQKVGRWTWERRP